MAVTVQRSPLRTHRLSGAEAPVVLAGYHQVADPGGPPASHLDSDVGDRSFCDSVGPGPGVELAHGAEVTGDHQACLSVFGVLPPGRIQGVEHLVAVAVGDPLMGLVGIDGVGGARPQLDAGPLLPGVMEAAHVGELGCEPVAVAHQGGEHSPGFDRAELTVVADQDDLRPGRRRGATQFVQGEGSGEARLVHDHQLARPEAPSGDFGFGGDDALAQRPAGTRETREGT